MGKPTHGVLTHPPCPSVATAPFLLRANIPPGPPRKFCLVSQRLWAFATHWDGQRTLLCTASAGECDWCGRRKVARWYAFGHVLDAQVWANRLLMLPRACYGHCADLQAAEGRLRGMCLTLQRRGSRSTGPLSAILGEAAWQRLLPATLDLRPLLARLFDLDVTMFGEEALV